MTKAFGKLVLPLMLGCSAAACSTGMTVDAGEGVRLDVLGRTGPPPQELVLAGPDSVTVRTGDRLDIAVAGDPAAVDALRFRIEDGALAIMRVRGSDVKTRAQVSVTMPSLREITLAGSGDIAAPSLTGDSSITIAGSGGVAVARVAAEALDVNIMGSGDLTAAGTARRLDMNVAGSGAMRARELKVDEVEINIAGSGGGVFASDGSVNASIAGSGQVRVFGNATCKGRKTGSGALICRPAAVAAR